MLNSVLLWNTIECVSTVIQCLFLKIVLDKLSERKKSKLAVNISVVLSITFIIFLNMININLNIKLAIGISLGYLFYICNYKFNLLKGLIINSVYWMTLVGIDFISVNLVLTMNPTTSISALLKNNIFRLELMIVSKLLLVSTIPIINCLKYNIRLKKGVFIHYYSDCSKYIKLNRYIYISNTSNK